MCRRPDRGTRRLSPRTKRTSCRHHHRRSTRDRTRIGHCMLHPSRGAACIRCLHPPASCIPILRRIRRPRTLRRSRAVRRTNEAWSMCRPYRRGIALRSIHRWGRQRRCCRCIVRSRIDTCGMRARRRCRSRRTRHRRFAGNRTRSPRRHRRAARRRPSDTSIGKAHRGPCRDRRDCLLWRIDSNRCIASQARNLVRAGFPHRHHGTARLP